MKILMYSTRSYDKISFRKELGNYSNIEIEFTESQLNETSVRLLQHNVYDAICVFVNDKVDVVFPVHVDFHTSVVTSFRIVVKAVQKGRVGDAFTDVLLIVDDDIGTNGRSNVFAVNVCRIGIIIPRFDTVLSLVSKFLCHHECDFAGKRTYIGLKNVFFRLECVTC